MNYEYLLHEVVNKIKESRILYIILLISLHTSSDKNALDQQVLVMVIQENSNKAYPSIKAHYQGTLEYSIIRK